MSPTDLSRLRIDRGLAPAAARSRRRRWIRVLVIAIIAIAAAAYAATRLSAPAAVETVTVANVYPSLNYTLLNATGYVVPQRKAALSSKAQGRLEWLGVL